MASCKAELEADLKSMKMGSPEDMSNFITAVISEGSFDKLAKAIDQAKKDSMQK
jgi:1-pyrroline-5-carboxylate dehydrogenase